MIVQVQATCCSNCGNVDFRKVSYCGCCGASLNKKPIPSSLRKIPKPVETFRFTRTPGRAPLNTPEPVDIFSEIESWAKPVAICAWLIAVTSFITTMALIV